MNQYEIINSWMARAETSGPCWPNVDTPYSRYLRYDIDRVPDGWPNDNSTHDIDIHDPITSLEYNSDRLTIV